MYELPALSTAVPCAVEFRLPPLPVGLKNVHLPVPITHIPLGTPPQLGSIESAGGGVAPGPAIDHVIANVSAGPALADEMQASPTRATDRARQSRRSMLLLSPP